MGKQGHLKVVASFHKALCCHHKWRVIIHHFGPNFHGLKRINSPNFIDSSTMGLIFVVIFSLVKSVSTVNW